MFDHSEVERGRIGDCLDVIRAVKVGVCSGNGGAVSNFDRLLERGAEIRIGRAAIPNTPTGVHIEVHEVRKAAEVLRAGGLADLQDAKFIEIDWIRSLGFQVPVEKGCVADFVNGVAGDVLRTIAIEKLESLLIIVLRSFGDAPKFRVLLPQVAFQQFRRGEEA